MCLWQLSNSPQHVSNKGKLLKVLKAVLGGFLLLGSFFFLKERNRLDRAQNKGGDTAVGGIWRQEQAGFKWRDEEQSPLYKSGHAGIKPSIES